jgi:hypothetical protein
MDNRLIFLYLLLIAQGFRLRAFIASTPAREHVVGEGCLKPRCGVTEQEDWSVRIDWTWNT